MEKKFKSLSSLKKKEAQKGALFASSYVIYSLIFWVYPVIWLLVLTFSKWRFIGTPKFDGLNNIIRVLGDPIFWKTLTNVFRFLGFYIPLVFICSMLFAMGLKKLKYGKTFIALSFLLANVSSGVAYSIVFTKLFGDNGPINQFLYERFGIIIPWFTSPSMAMFSISLIVIWKFVGYYGLIFYSGLNAIPDSLYEAADLDGAGRWYKLFKITLPLINNQIVMVLVLAITVAFGIFTEAYLITGGGPMQSTMTPMLVMYETAFQKMDPTYAATMSIFVAMASYGIVKITRKLLEKDVDIV